MTEILAAVIGALVVAALSVFITYRVAYPLGVKQGKEQLRHEESVRVLTKIRTQLLEVRNEFADWVHDIPSEESAQSDRTMKLIGDLQKYYEENRVVLDDDTRSAVEDILESLERRRNSLMMNLSIANLSNGEEEQRNARYRAGAETRAWLDNVLSRRLEEFEKRLASIFGQ